jgi:hypothetical protein
MSKALGMASTGSSSCIMIKYKEGRVRSLSLKNDLFSKHASRSLHYMISFDLCHSSCYQLL